MTDKDRPTGPCTECNQTDKGQTGEYPCKLCGLPTEHDRVQRTRDEIMTELTEHIEDTQAGRGGQTITIVEQIFIELLLDIRDTQMVR